MSIAGGLPRAIDRALEVGAGAIQIFVKNNNRWQGRVPEPEEEATFRNRIVEEGIQAALAHASYLINLASPDDLLWDRSILAMVDEIQRCSRLGLSHLVVHPGAHVGSGVECGIRRVSRAVNQIFQQCSSEEVRITLETTAGQGSCLGHRFEHLAEIMEGVQQADRVAICVDTCHIFAAGYEIRMLEGYRETMSRFEELLGLDCLQVLHFNDSRRELGSRVDRHANIGEGEIGAEAFGWFLRDPRLKKIPKILETPKGEDGLGDIRNLKVLRDQLVSTTSAGRQIPL